MNLLEFLDHRFDEAKRAPSKDLLQVERVTVAGIYFCALLWLYSASGGNILDIASNPNLDSNIWFYSGAFMIVLGVYLVEPFFTKPSNAVANSAVVLIAMLGLTNKRAFMGYWFVFIFSVLILCFGVMTIATKDRRGQNWEKFHTLIYALVSSLGSSRVIFSSVYVLAALSYFSSRQDAAVFLGMFALWYFLISYDIVARLVLNVRRFYSRWTSLKVDVLGEAIGCENPLLFRVEVINSNGSPRVIDFGQLVLMEINSTSGSIGMVVETRYLLNKRWLTIYLLQNSAGELLNINLKERKLQAISKPTYAFNNAVYPLELNADDAALRQAIESTSLFKNKDQFVGSVAAGSDIGKVHFSIVRDISKSGRSLSEGAVLEIEIYGRNTLYQVINGVTNEERLENFDHHGFTVGIARKLGIYLPDSKSLDVSRWMPRIFTPVFYAPDEEVGESRNLEIAENSIGRLPLTDLEIPLVDINAIVTHNTAILGILGIGKSCLTFELIKKIVDQSESKVVCFDITGEYLEELSSYGCSPKVLDVAAIASAILPKYTKLEESEFDGGNSKLFRQTIDATVSSFLSSDDRILIVNPEDYVVSKQTHNLRSAQVNGSWNQLAPLTDTTIVEKTRIFSEAIFDFFRTKGRSSIATCLLVFEEAHSLIPEWNSVANEGDKTATNGIAKVILQGRKYGLGSFVVTQRTANVSKSILNQCNTIFAMRVFDDTGKGFLENYIGTDYSDVLSTLEERHAIAIGKGLKLKQPVIIQLNDKKYVIPEAPAAESEPSVAHVGV